jgi:hypothetical protein
VGALTSLSAFCPISLGRIAALKFGVQNLSILFAMPLHDDIKYDLISSAYSLK